MKFTTQTKPPVRVEIDDAAVSFRRMTMADWATLAAKMPDDGGDAYMHRVLMWSYSPAGMVAMLNQQRVEGDVDAANLSPASLIQSLAEKVRDYGDDDDPKSATGS